MAFGAKKIAGAIRSLFGLKLVPRLTFNSAVIVAAGSGTRASDGGNVTKQLRTIDGIEVVCRSVNAFEKSKHINEIIIVARRDELPLYDGFAKKYGWVKVKSVVCGSDTRQKSVFCGMEAVSKKSEYIVIHDAARCLVTPDTIERVLCAACIYGGAIASQSVRDSVKIVDSRGFVCETPARSTVKLAQTPQAFKTDIYRAAAYTARNEGYEGTDDCELVTKAGFPVKLVEIEEENFKITSPRDFELAEAVIRNREKDEENGRN